MVNINDIKKYLWLVPLSGGILLLLSVFSPASYLIIGPLFTHFWMWGLTVGGIGFTVTGISFSLQIEVLVAGLLFTFFILICSILIIVITIQVKKETRKVDELRNFWISSGLIVILSSIAWIIMIESVAIAPFHPPDWWGYYNLGFAAIGPFIAGALLIATVFIDKYLKKRGKSS